ncbi:TPA: PP2C family serine/threonine-protein phosphatase [Vibrio diabolicus]
MLKLKECSSFTHAKSDERVNQDSILTPTKCGNGFVFGVADGVGSYKGADLASMSAIEYLEKHQLSKSNLQSFSLFENILAGVKELSLYDSDYETASTTLTYAYIDADEILIGHIGDCRAYVKQGNKLIQLTKDHTQHQMLIDQKMYTKAQLKNATGKNLITTAISQVVPMKPDFYTFKISDYIDEQQTITIYLMSDGAHSHWEQNPRFSPNTMKSVTKLSNSLLRRIERKGAKDDYSLVSCTFSF